MAKVNEKLLYHPPQITRVMLRQEQAILSQCSNMATSPRDRGSGRELSCASGDDDCKGWDSDGPPSADFGPRPS